MSRACAQPVPVGCYLHTAFVNLTSDNVTVRHFTLRWLDHAGKPLGDDQTVQVNRALIPNQLQYAAMIEPEALFYRGVCEKVGTVVVTAMECSRNGVEDPHCVDRVTVPPAADQRIYNRTVVQSSISAAVAEKSLFSRMFGQ